MWGNAEGPYGPRGPSLCQDSQQPGAQRRRDGPERPADVAAADCSGMHEGNTSRVGDTCEQFLNVGFITWEHHIIGMCSNSDRNLIKVSWTFMW